MRATRRLDQLRVAQKETVGLAENTAVSVRQMGYAKPHLTPGRR
jgi:hypothetical protein